MRPLIVQPPSTFVAVVADRGEVGARVRLAHADGEIALPGGDARQDRAPLLLRAVAQQQRPGLAVGDPVGGAGRAGRHHLLGDDVAVQRGLFAAAILLRPHHAEPAARSPILRDHSGDQPEPQLSAIGVKPPDAFSSRMNVADFLPERAFLRAELDLRKAEPVPRHAPPPSLHGPRIRDRTGPAALACSPAPKPDAGGGATPAAPGTEPLQHCVMICHVLSCSALAAAFPSLRFIPSALRSSSPARGPCFARIAWAPARGRGRAFRGGAVRAPDCPRARGRRWTYFSPPFLRVFSRRRESEETAPRMPPLSIPL